MNILRSLVVFILAGLCEIGGGYLIWQWLKQDKPLWYGILGGVILAAYGVVGHLAISWFWAGLCCLWRRFYANGPDMGLAG